MENVEKMNVQESTRKEWDLTLKAAIIAAKYSQNPVKALKNSLAHNGIFASDKNAEKLLSENLK